jgi:hypothetical protein
MDTAYNPVTPARLVNLVIFAAAVVACLAVEVVFVRGGIAFDTRKEVQFRIIAVVLGTAAIEAALWHRSGQEPKAGPKRRGFDVIKKDKP